MITVAPIQAFSSPLRFPWPQEMDEQATMDPGTTHRPVMVEEVLDHLQLPGHLGAAEDGHEGTRWRLQQDAEVAQLRCHQQPGRRLPQMVHDARGRRVRAMCRAESVVDVAVGRRGQRLGGDRR